MRVSLRRKIMKIITMAAAEIKEGTKVVTRPEAELEALCGSSLLDCGRVRDALSSINQGMRPSAIPRHHADLPVGIADEGLPGRHHG